MNQKLLNQKCFIKRTDYKSARSGVLNKDLYSKNFGTPWKTEIYFHRTNNDGFAGARNQAVAVSRGCPVISAPQWRGVEKQLGKISSFRLRIIR